MWLKSLKQHFTTKKRSQAEAASSSLTADDTADLVSPTIASEDEEEFNSRPKRRSVSIDINGGRSEMRRVSDRRTSLEQWHEARRARNSMEGQGTTTTDKLMVCRAGTTTIINKTYITIKHLGSGTFGRVMLAFNVYDQRLYAIKVCRKSQFAQLTHSRSHNRRLSRSQQTGSHNSLQSPSSSTSFTARSSGGIGGVTSCTGPMPTVSVGCSVATGRAVTCIHATSATVDLVDIAPAVSAAAAAASLLGSGNIGGCNSSGAVRPLGPFHAAAQVGWTAGQLQPPVGGHKDQHQQQVLQQPPFSIQQDQQQQQAAKLRQSPVAAAARAHSCNGISGFGQFGLGPPGNLCSSGNTGWGPGLMGTECSGAGTSAGSVFQEALMRFQTEELVKEIAILKKLNHPNIVNLVEVIDDPSTDSLLLVMEYVEGGTLEAPQIGGQRWEQMPERDVWRHVREILQGLDYLHHHKVVHGDLKPANLLLDSNSNKVKIADFGSSIMTGGDKIFSMRNCPGFSTPAFRSPESLTSGYQPSFEMDMWALGVCIYMWVFGCLPFTGVAPYIIYEKIRSQEVNMPPEPDVSPELKDFLAELLEKDVLKRLDVLSAMQHPWVTLGGGAPLASMQQQRLAQSMDVPSIALEGVQVSQEDIDAAIRQIGSGTYELMDVAFEEQHFSMGQELISPGDVADRMYLIAHGEVEIVTCGGDGGHLSVHEPLVTGADMDLSDIQETTDVWDSTHVSDISKDPATTSMMLLGEALSPWDSASSQPTACKFLAVKGPGDSLGGPLAHTDSSTTGGSNRQPQDRRWRVHVRARGDVIVFTTKLADLQKLVEAHPEMESAVKQIVTQQETDMMVAEAMRQLRLYNDCAHVLLSRPHVGGCQAGVVVAKS